jgi:hypothetical protein
VARSSTAEEHRAVPVAAIDPDVLAGLTIDTDT